MHEAVINGEEMVINIIQEYFSKNRYLNINKIVPFISSRIAKSSANINEQGIRQILQSLVKRNVIVKKTKFTREDVLLNSNRRLIYEHILKNPGIHFNKIYKDLHLNIPVAEWHLNMLTKFNYIQKEKIDNYEAYFDEIINPEYFKILHLISRDKGSKIIEFLKDNQEGYTKTFLSEELKMHINTVKKYIETFEVSGLIQKKDLFNKTLYFLNENQLNDLIKS